MDKKLIRNYIYSILYQLVKIVLPLLIVPYTYKHITPPVLGISDYAGSILQWFILVGILGVNTYGNREIAKVRDNQDDLNRSFFEILAMQIANMIVAMIAYYIFINFVQFDNLFIFKLTGLTMIASMLDISWFFYGMEDFKKASIRNIVVKCLGTALIFLICKTPDDLWKFVLINVGSELFGQFIMFFQLREYITFTPISLVNAYKHHFSSTFQLFIPTIAISVYTMLDQTMLGTLYGEEHLNYYKVSMGFIRMFLYLIVSIGSVVLPRMTNIVTNDEDGERKAQELIHTTLKISLALSLPMCFGMIAIARSFISWYSPTTPILASLIMMGSPIIILIAISNVTGTQYLVPVGMFDKYTKSVIFGSLTNFVINLLLISRYGAYGALIGSVIAELVVTTTQFLMIYKQVNLSFRERSMFIYLVSSLVMMVVVGFIIRILPQNIIGTVTSILIGAIIYFIMLLVSKEELCMKLVNLRKRSN